jgi:hypothetical protein
MGSPELIECETGNSVWLDHSSGFRFSWIIILRDAWNNLDKYHLIGSYLFRLQPLCRSCSGGFIELRLEEEGYPQMKPVRISDSHGRHPSGQRKIANSLRKKKVLQIGSVKRNPAGIPSR